MGTTTRTRMNISAEDFINAWQSSPTLDAVIEKLGLEEKDRQRVCQRATSYRGKDIELKKFPMGGGRHLDVESLQKLAKDKFSPTKARASAPKLSKKKRAKKN